MSEALVWILAAFFLVGAGINGVAPRSIRDDYARWGYPDWFHYVTAGAELCVAVGLLFSATRRRCWAPPSWRRPPPPRSTTASRGAAAPLVVLILAIEAVSLA